MASFATVEDYVARYGEVDDSARIETILADASAFIASYPGFVLIPEGEPGYEEQRANLVWVTCAVAQRTQNALGLAGIQSFTQSAVDYSATVSPYNPSGDMYLGSNEKRALRIIRAARIGQTQYA